MMPRAFFLKVNPVMKSLITMALGRHFADRLFAHQLSRERLGFLWKAAVARIAGKTVLCHLCGKPVAKVLPIIRRGKIELWGMHMCIAKVDFDDKNTLRFSHVLAENCEALRRHDRS